MTSEQQVIEANKLRFCSIFREKVTRPGADKLLEWIEGNTDFFTAPASTRFHSAYEGGLAAHSLNVYDVLAKRQPEPDDAESVAICALLHDLCKANFYVVAYRNKKNESGGWDRVPYYSIEDRFPFGHGEKSVFLIERFMRLKTTEAVAIRWHMGGFDDNAKAGGYTVSDAFSQYPLAVHMHLADLEATYLLEEK